MKVWASIILGSMGVLFITTLIWLMILAGCEHHRPVEGPTAGEIANP